VAGQGLHAKLAVSRPGDPEEEDADRFADRVMRMTDVSDGRARVRPSTTGGHRIHRTAERCATGSPCAACEEKAVHRRADAGSAQPSPAAAQGAVAALASGGRPLPETVRADFESKVGRDLSSVRIHTDAAAGTAARAIQARAYTLGRDVAFASGQFRPADSDGQRLLAHEIGHVLQHGGDARLSPEPIVRRQSNEVTIRNDAGQPNAGKPAAAAAKMPPASGHSDTLNNVQLSESKPQVAFAIKELVAKAGLPAADGYQVWLEDYTGPGLQSLQKFKQDYESPGGVSGGAPDEAEIDRREKARDHLLPVVRNAVSDINTEAARLVADFQGVMKANALQTLAASKRRAEAERLRYGVTTTRTKEKRPVKGGATVDVEVTKHAIADTKSPAVKGLKAAAALLLPRRKAVADKHREANKHIRCAMDMCVPDKDFARVNAEAVQLRKEYRALHALLSNDYPVLDRIGAIEEERALTEDAIWASKELERLANSESETEIATTIGDRIQDTIDKNETAREGVEGDRVNLWRLKEIYNLSKNQAGVEGDPFRNRVVGDRWKAEQPHIIEAVLEGIALLVLNIGAIILAAPTGGASLVVAFGVNAAMAVAHTQEYLLNKGVAGSDLRRAQSLSQDDPSFVWLALEIIGVGLDGAAAIHAMKALKPVVRAAQISREAEITVDAAKGIDDAAKALGKPELAKNVIGKVQKGNLAALEAAAPASKTEIGAFAKATRAIEEEATAGVSRTARSAVGGELRVSRAGHVWSCHSPCAMLRERYAQVFAGDENLLKRLQDLESRAASASKAKAATNDAKVIAEAEGELEKVTKAAAALENDADDVLRTLQNPAAAAVAKDVAESAAHQAPRIIPAARISEVAAKLGQRFPLVKRLSQGAMERVARAAFAAAEGGGLRRAARGLVAARAQLLEEISAVRVRALLATAEGRQALGVGQAGERAIFIEGSRIRDAGGAMLTDGIIAVQRGDRLEILAVLEAKAGRFAAEGLAESLGGLKRASTSEIMQALFEASGGGSSRGPLATIAKQDPALFKVISETRGANLAANEAAFREARESLMKAIENLPDAQLKAVRDALKGGPGQVSRDIERLMTGGDRTASLVIDGKPVTGWSPQRPQFLGSVPKGVETGDIAAQLAKEKFEFKALPFGEEAATKKQLDDAAKAVVEALEQDVLKGASSAAP
jgi:hypothetical protein